MIFEPKNPIPVVTPMGDGYVRDSGFNLLLKEN